MIERFQPFAPSSPRPPGRCPGCQKLALVPEAPPPDGPAMPDEPRYYCTRCGARYSRRFGRSWQALSTSGVSWLNEPGVAVQPLTVPRRFRIRELMIVVVWVALNLAPFSAVRDEDDSKLIVSAVIMLFLLNGFALYLVRTVRKLNPPPASSGPP